ncbi:MAG TPA: hypothetical protein VF711_05070 [Acidimicrobiales bacterium]|jgi:hypothetical protein
MATPVGPVAPDPNDPDLWNEWYDAEDTAEDDRTPSRFGWPVRIVALLVAIGIALLLVVAA